jgi:hypothetical protein
MFQNSGYCFLALLAACVAAFWPRYLSKAPGNIDAYTHAHALAMAAWVLLLVVQPFLIRARLRTAHRALGGLSYLVAPAVVVSSVLLAHTRFRAMSPLVFLAEAHNLYLPLSAAGLFAIAYAGAIFHRRVPALHAGFMACTALTLIDPVLGRILAFYLPPLPHDLYYQAITYGSGDLLLLYLILARGDDPTSRWALKTMLKLFVVAHVLWFTAAQSAAWIPFARWFRGLSLT